MVYFYHAAAKSGKSWNGHSAGESLGLAQGLHRLARVCPRVSGARSVVARRASCVRVPYAAIRRGLSQVHRAAGV